MSSRLLDAYYDQMEVDGLAGEQREAFAPPHPFLLHPEPIRCLLGEDEDPFDSWVLFGEVSLASTISENSNWLQVMSRSSSKVREVLFPHYRAAGMSRDEILQRISRGMFDAGYTPSNHGPNPTWTHPV